MTADLNLIWNGRERMEDIIKKQYSDCPPVHKNFTKWIETDLHLHLDGSISPELAKEMVCELGLDLKGRKLASCLQVKERCGSLAEYLTAFELAGVLLQTEKALEMTAYDLICRLHEQGLVYAEIRFAPQIHRRGGLTQQQVVEAVLKGIARGRRKTGLCAGARLCLMVEGTEWDNEETLDLARAYLGKGVAGMDLAGLEGSVPMKRFEGIFRKAARAGIPFTIHAGECGDYENIAAAVSFGARRIGHGCAAAYSSACMELLKRENITLEMCLLSNVQTGAVKSFEDHPLERFYRWGIPVTYNTDNMTVSDTTLEREAALIRRYTALTEGDLRRMNEMALEAGFAPEEERLPILNRLRQQKIEEENSFLS